MNDSGRILITPYLNTRAFVHHGPPPRCRLEPCAPKLAVAAMRRGAALAAVVPVAGLADLAGQVEPLGTYGIACRGAAQSVLLFSQRPFAEIDHGTRLALSADSMSSVRLLHLLLARRSPQRGLPHLVAAGATADAELVIGDAALRRAQDHAWPYVTDLATQWFLTHGRPMVFARWVVATGTAQPERARLRAWLDDYARNEEPLRAHTAAVDHARAGLDAVAALHYLTGIRTLLNGDDLAGQAIYERELIQHPWTEPASSAAAAHLRATEA